MSVEILQIIAAAAQGTYRITVANIAKIFKTNGKAINVNSIRILPTAFGTSVGYVVAADMESQDEQPLFDEMQAATITIAQGDTDTISQGPASGRYQSFWQFNANVSLAPEQHNWSLFPVFNSLTFLWDADVDFTAEIDYTVLDAFLDYRQVVMDLLANKTQVENPNLSNVDGKRKLVRAGLQIVED